MTGSDTSANALFSKLQVSAAENLQHAGIHGATPELMLAANTTGGVVGKMISPQSLAIAATSVDMEARNPTSSRLSSPGPSLCSWSSHPGLPADQRSVLPGSLI